MSSLPGFEAQSAGAVVQITLGQVFNEVRQVHDLLNTLTGKLEPMRDQLIDHENRLRKVDGVPDDVAGLGRAVETLRGDHETRLRKVELKAAAYAGGAAVLGGGIGSVVTVLLAHR